MVQAREDLEIARGVRQVLAAPAAANPDAPVTPSMPGTPEHAGLPGPRSLGHRGAVVWHARTGLRLVTTASLAASRRLAERRSARLASRSALPDPLPYPAELPIVGRKAELTAALVANQVLVVAGETGSGKSTQLPKICIEAG